MTIAAETPAVSDRRSVLVEATEKAHQVDEERWQEGRDARAPPGLRRKTLGNSGPYPEPVPEIDRELSRARAGHQVASSEHVEKRGLIDPLPTDDDLSPHQRDMCGRPAKSEKANLEEHGCRDQGW